MSIKNEMAKAYEKGPPPPPWIPPPPPEIPPPPPPLPRGYAPKSVAVSLLAGKTVLRNVCLSMVVSPPAPSPPPPKPPPLPKIIPGTARISGGITDAKTGFVLGDVIVRLNGLEQRPPIGGIYLFSDVDPGPYRLSAEKEGYKEFTWSIRLREKDDVKKDIRLEPIPVPVFQLPPGRWWRIRDEDWARDVWIPRGESFFIGAYDDLDFVINNFIQPWIRRYGGKVEDYVSEPYSAIGISPYVGRIISGWTKIKKVKES